VKLRHEIQYPELLLTQVRFSTLGSAQAGSFHHYRGPVWVNDVMMQVRGRQIICQNSQKTVKIQG
jgi:hypothetical protein